MPWRISALVEIPSKLVGFSYSYTLLSFKNIQNLAFKQHFPSARYVVESTFIGRSNLIVKDILEKKWDFIC